MPKAKILIVEDERIVAFDIKSSLELFDYDVTGIASNGIDALKLIEENKPDIVLMDIGLKGDLDGIEITKKINEKYQISVIYLTAFEDEKTFQRAKETSFADYLIKPFEDEQLENSIQKALNLNGKE